MHYTIGDYLEDLVQNSLEAGSPFTRVKVEEAKGFLEVKIEDTGKGMTEEELKELGIETLPASLYEAIQETEKSELVKKTLGDHIFESLIENKKIEWERYRIQITNYELEKYLPIL